MKYLGSLALLLSLTACAVGKPASTPAAPEEHTVSCDYQAGNWDDCRAQADAACQGATVEVLRQSSEPWVVSPQKPANSMVFICKRPAGTAS